MASAEKSMRKTLVRILKPLHAFSIENGVGLGTPDVGFAGGWIECKSLDAPAKPDTPIRAEHFTPQQKIWLTKHWAAGGVALMMAKVGPWWILLDAPTAVELVGKVPLGKLIDECINAWQSTPDRETLVDQLREICWKRTLPPTRS